MRCVELLYPEASSVSEERIMGWAADAFANGEIARPPSNLDDAIEQLHEAGLITACRRDKAPTSCGGPPYDDATASGMYDHY